MVSVARYVEDHEQQLGAIIGDEEYSQRAFNRQTMPRRRQLSSKFALVRLPTDDQRWIGIREVLKVDGRPVSNQAEQILASLKLRVEPGSGAITGTRLEVGLARTDVHARIDVRFSRDPKLQLWLPAEMSDQYSAPSGERVEGKAQYRNFKRFEVDASWRPR
jgi:hypothetical protein